MDLCNGHTQANIIIKGFTNIISIQSYMPPTGKLSNLIFKSNNHQAGALIEI